MRTEQEIKNRLDWLLNTAIDDEENQDSITQAKLWMQVDFIKWLVGENTYIDWCKELRK